MSEPMEIMEFLDVLKENQKSIKKALMTICVYMGSPTYEVLLNMPVNDRELLVEEYNKKIKKEQQAMK